MRITKIQVMICPQSPVMPSVNARKAISATPVTP